MVRFDLTDDDKWQFEVESSCHDEERGLHEIELCGFIIGPNGFHENFRYTCEKFLSPNGQMYGGDSFFVQSLPDFVEIQMLDQIREMIEMWIVDYHVPLFVSNKI
jgi:hypothetical protein